MPDFDDGQVIGGYRLGRKLGAGGMGVVYEATVPGGRETVAIKILNHPVGGEHAVARFRREAEAASRLNHPNIVAVREIGHQGTVWYYVMDLVRGWPLSHLLARLSMATQAEPDLDSVLHTMYTDSASSPVQDTSAPTVLLGQRKIVSPPEKAPRRNGHLSGQAQTILGTPDYIRRVCQMVLEVADALSHAHEQGVVHRDIKPENLLVDHSCRLHLVDFGLAQVANDISLTISGALMGTPMYMSPEQVAAGRFGIDHRTDIYSLGVVFYQFLCLKPLFSEATREAMLRCIAIKTPDPLRSRNPFVPRPLETIVHRAIEKDPDLRYATAREFAEDIRRFLEGKRIRAKRVSTAQRKWKSLTAPGKVAIVLAALLVPVLAILGRSLALKLAAGPQPAAQPPSSAGESPVWQARIDGACDHGDWSSVGPLIAASWGWGGAASDMTGFLRMRLAESLTLPLWNAFEYDGAGGRFAFSRSGQRLAAALTRSPVVNWWNLTSPESPHPLLLNAEQGPAFSIGFSADEECIVALTRSGIDIWKTSPPRDRMSIDLEEGSWVTWCRTNSDASLVLAGESKATDRETGMDTGRVKLYMPFSPSDALKPVAEFENVESARINPGRREFLCRFRDGRAEVFRADRDLRACASLGLVGRDVLSAAFDEMGTHVVALFSDFSAQVQEIETGSIVAAHPRAADVDWPLSLTNVRMESLKSRSRENPDSTPEQFMIIGDVASRTQMPSRKHVYVLSPWDEPTWWDGGECLGGEVLPGRGFWVWDERGFRLWDQELGDWGARVAVPRFVTAGSSVPDLAPWLNDPHQHEFRPVSVDDAGRLAVTISALPGSTGITGTTGSGRKPSTRESRSPHYSAGDDRPDGFQVILWDIRTATPLAAVPCGVEALASAGLTPDGQWVFAEFRALGNALYLYEVDPGFAENRWTQAPLDGDRIRKGFITRSGRSIVVQLQESGSLVEFDLAPYDAVRGPVRTLLEASAPNLWTTDGSGSVAALAEDGLRLMGRHEPTRAIPGTSGDDCLAISTSGDGLTTAWTTASGELRVLDPDEMADGTLVLSQDVDVIPTGLAPPRVLAVAEQGTCLAVGDGVRQVRLWRRAGASKSQFGPFSKSTDSFEVDHPFDRLALDAEGRFCVADGPDGNLTVAVATPGGIRVGKSLAVRKFDGAFSPSPSGSSGADESACETNEPAPAIHVLPAALGEFRAPPILAATGHGQRISFFAAGLAQKAKGAGPVEVVVRPLGLDWDLGETVVDLQFETAASSDPRGVLQLLALDAGGRLHRFDWGPDQSDHLAADRMIRQSGTRTWLKVDKATFKVVPGAPEDPNDQDTSIDGPDGARAGQSLGNPRR